MLNQIEKFKVAILVLLHGYLDVCMDAGMNADDLPSPRMIYMNPI